MRKVAGVLLWLYVFTVPWDVVAIPGMGTSTRLVGVLAISAAIFTIAAEGRFRKPDLIFGLAMAFTAFSALSVLWTVSAPNTVEAVWSYAQLLGSLWVTREVARTREQQQWLLVAFCFGAFVPMLGLLNNFSARPQVGAATRYSVAGFNANGIGLLLAMGMPVAWHLILTYRGALRVIAVTFFSLAPLAILLTGSRGGFLAGIAPIAIALVNLGRRSIRSFFLVVVLLGLITATITQMVPQASWDRMATIPGEILGGGSMSTRRELWAVGLEAFLERPLLGFGAGAYGTLLQNRGERAAPAHNVIVGLLAEQGIVGLTLYIALIGACVLTIARMPRSDRSFWAVLMLSWAIGLMSLSIERWKVTWLLFGLLAARNGLEPVLHYARRSELMRTRRDAPSVAAPMRSTSPMSRSGMSGNR